MLVLTRKIGERVFMDDEASENRELVYFTVLEINKGQVRIGIDAPKHIAVHREEVFHTIQAEKTRKKTMSALKGRQQ